MRVTLVDSPFANLANIARALDSVGARLTISADPRDVAAATKLVLPGVGSFAAAMQWLRDRGLDAALRTALASGSSLLGICLGHQLLFDRSDEAGDTAGLGIVRGRVSRFECDRVPQIGWNQLHLRRPSALFDGVSNRADVYFVNSYRVSATDDAIAVASYAGEFVAAVQRGRVFGVQFHPEKSSSVGRTMLRNFVRLGENEPRSEEAQ